MVEHVPSMLEALNSIPVMCVCVHMRTHTPPHTHKKKKKREGGKEKKMEVTEE